MPPVAPDGGRLVWARCARAALTWSRAGYLARRTPLLAVPLTPLTGGLHLVVAVSQYDDLWVDRHAAIVVRAGAGSTRRPWSLGLAVLVALAPWAGLCALALLLAVRGDARWLAAPGALAGVVLVDVGWELLTRPVRGTRARRELGAAHRAGATVLLSLAAHPAGHGHGAAMMTAVAHAVQRSGRPAVLECRDGLVGWYARWGFAPHGDALRREPDRGDALAPGALVGERPGVPGVRSDA